MTVPTLTQDVTARDIHETAPEPASRVWAQAPSGPALTGKLYQFHSFRVLDADDRPVGIVDWIWSDDAGSAGEFIGVQLRWLRGTARAVPADRVQIDRQSATVRVAYGKDQIRQAPRFAIDRALTVEQKRSIRSHYRPSPSVVPSSAMAEGLAA